MYPSQFKIAEIILIPKETGDKNDPINYRPISLLNFLGKVYAKLLNKKLVKHLEENQIIKPSQHGFRKKKSTSTLIAQLYERIAREKGTDRKTMVTMVLRDISKAFDKVWHEGLIYKMLNMGLEENLLCTLADFLRDRSAYIKVNKTKGTPFNLEAGVPNPTYNREKRNFYKQYADDFYLSYNK